MWNHILKTAKQGKCFHNKDHLCMQEGRYVTSLDYEQSPWKWNLMRTCYGNYNWNFPSYLFLKYLALSVNPLTHKLQYELYDEEGVCVSFCESVSVSISSSAPSPLPSWFCALLCPSWNPHTITAWTPLFHGFCLFGPVVSRWLVDREEAQQQGWGTGFLPTPLSSALFLQPSSFPQRASLQLGWFLC